MGQDKKRILGIIPVKSHSRRFPGKNFYNYSGKPLWKHSYDVLKPVCDSIKVISDTLLDQDTPFIDGISRPINATNTDASILDVLRFGYMSLNEPFDIIVCLFANTVDFTNHDIDLGIKTLIDNKLQEVRGFNYSGVENGLLIMTTERLFNPPGISSYLGCVMCDGREIHYKSELE